ncbi:hypothetical protein [Candidatus Lokiarchaeum ossiferum]|uniref:hypothetical protein n=1 Tax=Candidatus Lokiarchaeum ossiferum TaxID=2951803 RepID=UPI00352C47C4
MNNLKSFNNTKIISSLLIFMFLFDFAPTSEVSACDLLPLPKVSDFNLESELYRADINDNQITVWDTLKIQFTSPVDGIAKLQFYRNGSDRSFYEEKHLIDTGFCSFDVLMDPERNICDEKDNFLPDNYSVKLTILKKSPWYIPIKVLAYSDAIDFEVVKGKANFIFTDENIVAITQMFSDQEMNFLIRYSAVLQDSFFNKPLSDIDVHLLSTNHTLDEFESIVIKKSDLDGSFEYKEIQDNIQYGKLAKFVFYGNELYDPCYLEDDLDPNHIFDIFNYTMPDFLNKERENNVVSGFEDMYSDMLQQSNSFLIQSWDWRNISVSDYKNFQFWPESGFPFFKVDSELDLCYIGTYSNLKKSIKTKVLSPSIFYQGIDGTATISTNFRAYQDINGLSDSLMKTVFNISIIVTDEYGTILDKKPMFLGNSSPWNFNTMEMNSNIFSNPNLIRIGFEIQINPGKTPSCFDAADEYYFLWDYLSIEVSYPPVLTLNPTLNRWNGYNFVSKTDKLEGFSHETYENFIFTNGYYPECGNNNELGMISTPLDFDAENTGVENYEFNDNPFTSANTWGYIDNMKDGFDWAIGNRSKISDNSDYFTNFNLNGEPIYDVHYKFDKYSYNKPNKCYYNTPSLILSEKNQWVGFGTEILIPDIGLDESIIKISLKIGTSEYYHPSSDGDFRIKILMTDLTNLQSETIWETTWKNKQIHEHTINAENTIESGIYYFSLIVESNEEYLDAENVQIYFDNLKIRNIQENQNNSISFKADGRIDLKNNPEPRIIKGFWNFSVEEGLIDLDTMSNLNLNLGFHFGISQNSLLDGNAQFLLSIIPSYGKNSIENEISVINSVFMPETQYYDNLVNIQEFINEDLNGILLKLKIIIPPSSYFVGSDPSDIFFMKFDKIELISQSIIRQDLLLDLNMNCFYSETFKITPFTEKSFCFDKYLDLTFQSSSSYVSSGAYGEAKAYSPRIDSYHFPQTLFEGNIHIEFSSAFSSCFPYSYLEEDQIIEQKFYFDLYLEDDDKNLFLAGSTLLWMSDLSINTPTDTISIDFEISELFYENGYTDFSGDFQVSLRLISKSLYEGYLPSFKVRIHDFDISLKDLPPEGFWSNINSGDILSDLQEIQVTSEDLDLERVKFTAFSSFSHTISEIVLMGTDTKVISWVLNTSALPDGNTILTAELMDNSGQIKEISSISILIDNTPPDIRISNIDNNEILKRPISVEIESNDEDISALYLEMVPTNENWDNPTIIGIDSDGGNGWQIYFDITQYSEGFYDFRIRALDYAKPVNIGYDYKTNVMISLIEPEFLSHNNETSRVKDTIDFIFKAGTSFLDKIEVFYSNTKKNLDTNEIPQNFEYLNEFTVNLNEDIYEMKIDTNSVFTSDEQGYYFLRFDFLVDSYLEQCYFVLYVDNQPPVFEINVLNTQEIIDSDIWVINPDNINLDVFTQDSDLNTLTYYYERNPNEKIILSDFSYNFNFDLSLQSNFGDGKIRFGVYGTDLVGNYGMNTTEWINLETSSPSIFSVEPLNASQINILPDQENQICFNYFSKHSDIEYYEFNYKYAIKDGMNSLSIIEEYESIENTQMNFDLVSNNEYCLILTLEKLRSNDFLQNKCPYGLFLIINHTITDLAGNEFSREFSYQIVDNEDFKKPTIEIISSNINNNDWTDGFQLKLNITDEENELSVNNGIYGYNGIYYADIWYNSIDLSITETISEINQIFEQEESLLKSNFDHWLGIIPYDPILDQSSFNPFCLSNWLNNEPVERILIRAIDCQGNIAIEIIELNLSKSRLNITDGAEISTKDGIEKNIHFELLDIGNQINTITYFLENPETSEIMSISTEASNPKVTFSNINESTYNLYYSHVQEDGSTYESHIRKLSFPALGERKFFKKTAITINDSVPYDISLSILNNTLITGSHEISTSVGGNYDIERIEYFIDDFNKPFETLFGNQEKFILNSIVLQNGIHQIKSRVWYKNGNPGDSQKITIIVDNSAPFWIEQGVWINNIDQYSSPHFTNGILDISIDCVEDYSEITSLIIQILDIDHNFIKEKILTQGLDFPLESQVVLGDIEDGQYFIEIAVQSFSGRLISDKISVIYDREAPSGSFKTISDMIFTPSLDLEVEIINDENTLSSPISSIEFFAGDEIQPLQYIGSGVYSSDSTYLFTFYNNMHMALTADAYFEARILDQLGNSRTIQCGNKVNFIQIPEMTMLINNVLNGFYYPEDKNTFDVNISTWDNWYLETYQDEITVEDIQLETYYYNYSSADYFLVPTTTEYSSISGTFKVEWDSANMDDNTWDFVPISFAQLGTESTADYFVDKDNYAAVGNFNSTNQQVLFITAGKNKKCFIYEPTSSLYEWKRDLIGEYPIAGEFIDYNIVDLNDDGFQDFYIITTAQLISFQWEIDQWIKKVYSLEDLEIPSDFSIKSICTDAIEKTLLIGIDNEFDELPGKLNLYSYNGENLEIQSIIELPNNQILLNLEHDNNGIYIVQDHSLLQFKDGLFQVVYATLINQFAGPLSISENKLIYPLVSIDGNLIMLSKYEEIENKWFSYQTNLLKHVSTISNLGFDVIDEKSCSFYISCDTGLKYVSFSEQVDDPESLSEHLEFGTLEGDKNIINPGIYVQNKYTSLPSSNINDYLTGKAAQEFNDFSMSDDHGYTISAIGNLVSDQLKKNISVFSDDSLLDLENVFSSKQRNISGIYTSYLNMLSGGLTENSIFGLDNPQLNNFGLGEIGIGDVQEDAIFKQSINLDIDTVIFNELFKGLNTIDQNHGIKGLEMIDSYINCDPATNFNVQDNSDAYEDLETEYGVLLTKISTYNTKVGIAADKQKVYNTKDTAYTKAKEAIPAAEKDVTDAKTAVTIATVALAAAIALGWLNPAGVIIASAAYSAVVAALVIAENNLSKAITAKNTAYDQRKTAYNELKTANSAVVTAKKAKDSAKIAFDTSLENMKTFTLPSTQNEIGAGQISIKAENNRFFTGSSGATFDDYGTLFIESEILLSNQFITNWGDNQRNALGVNLFHTENQNDNENLVFSGNPASLKKIQLTFMYRDQGNKILTIDKNHPFWPNVRTWYPDSNDAVSKEANFGNGFIDDYTSPQYINFNFELNKDSLNAEIKNWDSLYEIKINPILSWEGLSIKDARYTGINSPPNPIYTQCSIAREAIHFCDVMMNLDDDSRNTENIETLDGKNWEVNYKTIDQQILLNLNVDNLESNIKSIHGEIPLTCDLNSWKIDNTNKIITFKDDKLDYNDFNYDDGVSKEDRDFGLGFSYQLFNFVEGDWDESFDQILVNDKKIPASTDFNIGTTSYSIGFNFFREQLDNAEWSDKFIGKTNKGDNNIRIRLVPSFRFYNPEIYGYYSNIYKGLMPITKIDLKNLKFEQIYNAEAFPIISSKESGTYKIEANFESEKFEIPKEFSGRDASDIFAFAEITNNMRIYVDTDQLIDFIVDEAEIEFDFNKLAVAFMKTEFIIEPVKGTQTFIDLLSLKSTSETADLDQKQVNVTAYPIFDNGLMYFDLESTYSINNNDGAGYEYFIKNKFGSAFNIILNGTWNHFENLPPYTPVSYFVDNDDSKTLIDVFYYQDQDNSLGGLNKAEPLLCHKEFDVYTPITEIGDVIASTIQIRGNIALSKWFWNGNNFIYNNYFDFSEKDIEEVRDALNQIEELNFAKSMIQLKSSDDYWLELNPIITSDKNIDLSNAYGFDPISGEFILQYLIPNPNSFLNHNNTHKKYSVGLFLDYSANILPLCESGAFLSVNIEGIDVTNTIEVPVEQRTKTYTTQQKLELEIEKDLQMHELVLEISPTFNLEVKTPQGLRFPDVSVKEILYPKIDNLYLSLYLEDVSYGNLPVEILTKKIDGFWNVEAKRFEVSDVLKHTFIGWSDLKAFYTENDKISGYIQLEWTFENNLVFPLNISVEMGDLPQINIYKSFYKISTKNITQTSVSNIDILDFDLDGDKDILSSDAMLLINEPDSLGTYDIKINASYQSNFIAEEKIIISTNNGLPNPKFVDLQQDDIKEIAPKNNEITLKVQDYCRGLTGIELTHQIDGEFIPVEGCTLILDPEGDLSIYSFTFSVADLNQYPNGPHIFNVTSFKDLGDKIVQVSEIAKIILDRNSPEIEFTAIYEETQKISFREETLDENGKISQESLIICNITEENSLKEFNFIFLRNDGDKDYFIDSYSVDVQTLYKNLDDNKYNFELDLLNILDITSKPFNKMVITTKDQAGNEYQKIMNIEIDMEYNVSLDSYEERSYLDYIEGYVTDTFCVPVKEKEINFQFGNNYYFKDIKTDEYGFFSFKLDSADLYSDDLRSYVGDSESDIYVNSNLVDFNNDSYINLEGRNGQIDSLQYMFYFDMLTDRHTINYDNLNIKSLKNETHPYSGIHFDLLIPSSFSPLTGSTTYDFIEIAFVNETGFEYIFLMDSEFLESYFLEFGNNPNYTRTIDFIDLMILQIDIPFITLELSNGEKFDFSSIISIKIMGKDVKRHPNYNMLTYTDSFQYLGCAGIYLQTLLNNATFDNPEGKETEYNVHFSISSLENYPKAYFPETNRIKIRKREINEIEINDLTWPSDNSIQFFETISMSSISLSNSEIGNFDILEISKLFKGNYFIEGYNLLKEEFQTIGYPTQILMNEKGIELLIAGDCTNYSPVKIFFSGNSFVAPYYHTLSKPLDIQKRNVDFDVIGSQYNGIYNFEFELEKDYGFIGQMSSGFNANGERNLYLDFDYNELDSTILSYYNSDTGMFENYGASTSFNPCTTLILGIEYFGDFYALQLVDINNISMFTFQFNTSRGEPFNLHPGVYDLKCQFKGSNHYNPATLSGKLSIASTKVQLDYLADPFCQNNESYFEYHDKNGEEIGYMHETITYSDPTTMRFKISDPYYEKPLSNVPVWMQIGFVPRMLTETLEDIDYNLADSDGEYLKLIESDTPNYYLFNTWEQDPIEKPLLYPYCDDITGRWETFGPHYYNYSISDDSGIVTFEINPAAFETIFEDYQKIFEKDILTIEEIELYIRVFYNPDISDLLVNNFDVYGTEISFFTDLNNNEHIFDIHDSLDINPSEDDTHEGNYIEGYLNIERDDCMFITTYQEITGPGDFFLSSQIVEADIDDMGEFTSESGNSNGFKNILQSDYNDFQTSIQIWDYAVKHPVMEGLDSKINDLIIPYVKSCDSDGVNSFNISEDLIGKDQWDQLTPGQYWVYWIGSDSPYYNSPNNGEAVKSLFMIKSQYSYAMEYSPSIYSLSDLLFRGAGVIYDDDGSSTHKSNTDGSLEVDGCVPQIAGNLRVRSDSDFIENYNNTETILLTFSINEIPISRFTLYDLTNSDLVEFILPLNYFEGESEIDFKIEASLLIDPYQNQDENNSIPTETLINEYIWGASNYILEICDLSIIESNKYENGQEWNLMSEIKSFDGQYDGINCDLDSSGKWIYENGIDIVDSYKMKTEIGTNGISDDKLQLEEFTTIGKSDNLFIDWTYDSQYKDISDYTPLNYNINASFILSDLFSPESLNPNYSTSEGNYSLDVGYILGNSKNNSIRTAYYEDSEEITHDALYFGLQKDSQVSLAFTELYIPWNASLNWDFVLSDEDLFTDSGDILKIDLIVDPQPRGIGLDSVTYYVSKNLGQIEFEEVIDNNRKKISSLDYFFAEIESCMANIFINVTALQVPTTDEQLLQWLFTPAWIQGDEIAVQMNGEVPDELRARMFSNNFMYFYTLGAFEKWGKDNLKVDNTVFSNINDIYCNIEGDLANVANLFDWETYLDGAEDEYKTIDLEDLPHLYADDDTLFEFHEDDNFGSSFNRLMFDVNKIKKIDGENRPKYYSGQYNMYTGDQDPKLLASRKISLLFTPMKWAMKLFSTQIDPNSEISTKYLDVKFSEPSISVPVVNIQYELNQSLSDKVVSNWGEIFQKDSFNLPNHYDILFDDLHYLSNYEGLDISDGEPEKSIYYDDMDHTLTSTLMASTNYYGRYDARIDFLNAFDLKYNDSLYSYSFKSKYDNLLPRDNLDNYAKFAMPLTLTNMTNVSRFRIDLAIDDTQSTEWINSDIDRLVSSDWIDDYANYEEYKVEIDLKSISGYVKAIGIALEFEAGCEPKQNTSIGFIGWGFFQDSSLGKIIIDNTYTMDLLPTCWNPSTAPYMESKILNSMLGESKFDEITIASPNNQPLKLYSMTILDYNSTDKKITNLLYQYEFNEQSRHDNQVFQKMVNNILFSDWEHQGNIEIIHEPWYEFEARDYNGDFEYDVYIEKFDGEGLGIFDNDIGDVVSYDYNADGIVEYQIMIDETESFFNVTNVQELGDPTGDDGHNEYFYVAGSKTKSTMQYYDLNQDGDFDAIFTDYLTINANEVLPSLNVTFVEDGELKEFDWTWNEESPTAGIKRDYDFDFDGIFEMKADRKDLFPNPAFSDDFLVNYDQYWEYIEESIPVYNEEGEFIDTKIVKEINTGNMHTEHATIKLMGYGGMTLESDFIITEGPIMDDAREASLNSAYYQGIIYWYDSNGDGRYETGFIMTYSSSNYEIPTAIGVYYDLDGDMKVAESYKEYSESSDIFVPSYWTEPGENLATIRKIAADDAWEEYLEELSSPEGITMRVIDLISTALIAAASAAIGAATCGVLGFVAYAGLQALYDYVLRPYIEETVKTFFEIGRNIDEIARGEREWWRVFDLEKDPIALNQLSSSKGTYTFKKPELDPWFSSSYDNSWGDKEYTINWVGQTVPFQDSTPFGNELGNSEVIDYTISYKIPVLVHDTNKLKVFDQDTEGFSLKKLLTNFGIDLEKIALMLGLGDDFAQYDFDSPEFIEKWNAYWDELQINLDLFLLEEYWFTQVDLVESILREKTSQKSLTVSKNTFRNLGVPLVAPRKFSPTNDSDLIIKVIDAQAAQIVGFYWNAYHETTENDWRIRLIELGFTVLSILVSVGVSTSVRASKASMTFSQYAKAQGKSSVGLILDEFKDELLVEEMIKGSVNTLFDSHGWEIETIEYNLPGLGPQYITQDFFIEQLAEIIGGGIEAASGYSSHQRTYGKLIKSQQSLESSVTKLVTKLEANNADVQQFFQNPEASLAKTRGSFGRQMAILFKSVQKSVKNMYKAQMKLAGFNSMEKFSKSSQGSQILAQAKIPASVSTTKIFQEIGEAIKVSKTQGGNVLENAKLMQTLGIDISAGQFLFLVGWDAQGEYSMFPSSNPDDISDPSRIEAWIAQQQVCMAVDPATPIATFNPQTLYQTLEDNANTPDKIATRHLAKIFDDISINSHSMADFETLVQFRILADQGHNIKYPDGTVTGLTQELRKNGKAVSILGVYDAKGELTGVTDISGNPVRHITLGGPDRGSFRHFLTIAAKNAGITQLSVVQNGGVLDFHLTNQIASPGQSENNNHEGTNGVYRQVDTKMEFDSLRNSLLEKVTPAMKLLGKSNSDILKFKAAIKSLTTLQYEGGPNIADQDHAEKLLVLQTLTENLEFIAAEIQKDQNNAKFYLDMTSDLVSCFSCQLFTSMMNLLLENMFGPGKVQIRLASGLISKTVGIPSLTTVENSEIAKFYDIFGENGQNLYKKLIEFVKSKNRERIPYFL